MATGRRKNTSITGSSRAAIYEEHFSPAQRATLNWAQEKKKLEQHARLRLACMLDPWLSDASSEDEIVIRKRQRCALTPVERLAARKRRRRTTRIDKPLGGRVALQSYWSSCLPGVLLPLLELVFDTLIPNKYDAVEYFSTF